MTIIDKDTFNHLVKHPNAVDADVIPKLEATIKAFPYCQISYSLLAKASVLLSPEKFNETKPKAAAYALSRVALQHLVENNNERFDPTLFEREQTGPMAASALQDQEDIIIAVVEQETGPTQAEKTEEQKRQQKIIQGFIKNNPRISTIKAESIVETPVVNIAGRVAQEGPGLIETEAFAKILLRQGKIDKAIDIYQKLILKKPEKKNYFAKKLSELYHSGT